MTGSTSTERATCPQCGGSGVVRSIERGEHRVDVECVCGLRLRKRLALGDDIYTAPVIRESPLNRKTTTNVFVTAAWRALLPHLRLALGMAWHAGELEARPFTFKVVTDEQILRASLARDRDPDQYEVTIGGASLLIVRLGFLGWRNQAMAGYLREALMRRLDVDRAPVWLADTPKLLFESGHLSWDAAVGAYVAEHCERVRL